MTQRCRHCRYVDDCGSVIKEYDSLGNAANDVGGHKTNVARSLPKSTQKTTDVFVRNAVTR